MSFDANILNVICKYIDDPKTFFNFALVCRKTRYVTKLYKNNKMDQFAIKYIKTIENGQLVERRLPNGELHGDYERYSAQFGDDFYMYYNGICLSYWWYDHYGASEHEVTITHYKCDCTKEFENSYANNKIGLDGVTYKLCSTTTTTHKCDTCGDHNLEQEVWCNFEREKLSESLYLRNDMLI